MNEKNIKKIPKYIENKIRKLDMEYLKTHNSKTRFYAYLTSYKKELCHVIVAVKNRGKVKWNAKQVVVHAIDSDKVYLKDICFSNISGYQVGWYEEGYTHYRRYYEDGEWGWNLDKYFNICCEIVNINYLDRLPEFKYSQVKEYYKKCSSNILKYLRIYREHPCIEYLSKMGLYHFATSKYPLAKLHLSRKSRH